MCKLIAAASAVAINTAVRATAIDIHTVISAVSVQYSFSTYKMHFLLQQQLKSYSALNMKKNNGKPDCDYFV